MSRSPDAISPCSRAHDHRHLRGAFCLSDHPRASTIPITRSSLFPITAMSAITCDSGDLLRPSACTFRYYPPTHPPFIPIHPKVIPSYPDRHPDLIPTVCVLYPKPSQAPGLIGQQKVAKLPKHKTQRNLRCACSIVAMAFAPAAASGGRRGSLAFYSPTMLPRFSHVINCKIHDAVPCTIAADRRCFLTVSSCRCYYRKCPPLLFLHASPSSSPA
jgi:hypothetical protein